jgi:hypothetical protein
MDPIAEAALRAAEEGYATPKSWHVRPDAVIEYANGWNPFEGMTVTHWSVD